MGLCDHRQQLARQRRCFLIVATHLGKAHLVRNDFDQESCVQIGNGTAPLTRVCQPMPKKSLSFSSSSRIRPLKDST